jgi:SAM-dependent methyltransferase
MPCLDGTIIRLKNRHQEYKSDVHVKNYFDWLLELYKTEWPNIVRNNKLPPNFSIDPQYYAKWVTVASIMRDLGSDYFNVGKHLELGARGSFFGPYIARLTNEVVVSDNFVSWPMLGSFELWEDIWKRFAKEHIKVSNIDCNDLSVFSENYFDTIVSISVVEHIPNEKLFIKSFKEAFRVLKPGGLYIVDTDMVDGNEAKWFGFQNFFSLSYINKIASDAGFKCPSNFIITKEDLSSKHPIGQSFCCGLIYFIK